jgi:hypothetical protein
MAMYAFARGPLSHFSLTCHDPADPNSDVVHPSVPPAIADRARTATAGGAVEGYIDGWWYHGFNLNEQQAALMLLRTRGQDKAEIIARKHKAIAAIEKAASDMLARLPADKDEPRQNALLDDVFL